MASEGEFLTGLWLEDQKYFASTLSQDHAEEDDLAVFDQVRQWLDIYFSGHDPGFTPPLLFRSSVFRIRVWNQLLSIPFGETVTYGELAHRIAVESGVCRMSAQAIGGAVSHNPISLIVPCHRVVASDGSPGGYAGGQWRKERLIVLEQSHLN